MVNGGNMGKDGSNVIDFTRYRTNAVARPLREIEAYWEIIRDGRLVPDRSALDPRGFADALAHSFLLERIAPGLARIRVSGRHISDLMGIDMQGLPLSSLFLPEARPTVTEILSALFEEPAVARLWLTSAGSVGRHPLEAQMLLLPLRDEDGEVTRAVGCIVATGPIGRTPRRFAIAEMQCRTLIGFGRRAGDAAMPPAQAAPVARGTVIALPPRRE
jgi:hypothetical protein